ncbi:MAG: response regulator [Pleurocapsa sp.]
MNHSSIIKTEPSNSAFSNDFFKDILKQIYQDRSNICLQIAYNSVIFFVHFNQGKFVYATNSLAPFERLERHLRRLSNQNSKLTDKNIIKQARLKFRDDLESYSQFPSDYKGILWLAEQGHLDSREAVTLLRRITREVFESLLSLSTIDQYKLVPRQETFQELCSFDLKAYVQQCCQRLQAWQAFSKYIWSSYQRPYLLTETTKEIGNLTPEQNETICKLLNGLNFRQISALIDRDELVVAKILYPSIVNRTIVVRDPKTPFDQLPRLLRNDCPITNINQDNHDELPTTGNLSRVNSNSKETIQTLDKNWKIAYVDDSRVSQKNVCEILDSNLFEILSIEDSMKAFAELIEFQPDLILLDVNMPNINGYELCTLLKNYHDFKNIPIVMIDEEHGLINLTKFKLVGATDRLTKPFDQTALFNVIFKYLQ